MAKYHVVRQLVLLAIGLVVLLVVAGQLARADAGPSPADPEDSRPAWASDGVHVAFERQVPANTRVFSMTSAGRDTNLTGGGGELRGYVPGTTHLLVQTGDETLVLTGSRFDGPLATLRGTDATASPDGRRVAYVRDGILYVAGIDGSGEHIASTNVFPPPSDILGPVWSPDGSRIVVASGRRSCASMPTGLASRRSSAAPVRASIQAGHPTARRLRSSGTMRLTGRSGSCVQIAQTRTS